MKELRIPIHSFVDVVTNSSTMIYVMPNEGSVSAMYDIIDEILKVSGSEKKAKDLFEVYYQPTGDVFDYLQEEEVENEEDIEGELMDIAKKDRVTEEEYEKLSAWVSKQDEYYDCANIVVKAKEEGSVNLMRKIMSLFDINGSRDG